MKSQTNSYVGSMALYVSYRLVSHFNNLQFFTDRTNTSPAL